EIERMTPKITAICERYPQENILLVSQGAALCAEIRHLWGIPLSKTRDNGGLEITSTSILETTDNGQTFKCIEWNKNDYLKRDIDPTDVV
ncbi:histidine phosphatase family protein, partial [Campylobacter sp. 2018MI13]|uniref:histidine phosphatase family protein n=1 Tax=Campylobacter sp. 2018MI13 TaxID=2836737 RepID=UPI001BD9CF9D